MSQDKWRTVENQTEELLWNYLEIERELVVEPRQQPHTLRDYAQHNCMISPAFWGQLPQLTSFYLLDDWHNVSLTQVNYLPYNMEGKKKVDKKNVIKSHDKCQSMYHMIMRIQNLTS